MNARHSFISACALAGTLGVMSAPADAQSIEDRLRSQLRETTLQLRQLQDGQSQMQAQLSSAQHDRDKALADLKQAQADLAAAKQRPDASAAAARALAAERASHAKDSAELAKYRADDERLAEQSRTRQTAIETRDTQLAATRTALQTCEFANAKLYDVGHQILRAYEQIGLGTFLKSREPFAQGMRVKYDQLAEQYGDQLYAGKFDPNARPATAAPPASGAEAQ